MTHRSHSRLPRSGTRRWLVAAAGVALLGTLVPARTMVRTAFGQRRPQAATTTGSAVTGYEVLSYGMDVAAGNTGVIERACTSGKQPLGGGFYFPTANQISGPDVAVIESSPRTTASGTTGWRVVANNRTSSTQRMEVWVICATASL